MAALRAVIYLPDGPDLQRWQHRCMEHLEAHGYELVSVVIDDTGGARWASVSTLLLAGRADVVVIARRDHLPPDRLPRFEVANDEPTLNLRQARPRLILRRSAAG